PADRAPPEKSPPSRPPAGSPRAHRPGLPSRFTGAGRRLARLIPDAGPTPRDGSSLKTTRRGPMTDATDDTPSIDLIRWTFTSDPARRRELEDYLNDLGLDVLVRGEAQFVVTWEEPEGDADEVVEELWEINGQPFEVTHEEFGRLGLFTY